MRIWRILYENGDEVHVANETLEEAVECARSQGEIPFSQVMEIAEVRELPIDVDFSDPLSADEALDFLAGE